MASRADSAISYCAVIGSLSSSRKALLEADITTAALEKLDLEPKGVLRTVEARPLNIFSKWLSLISVSWRILTLNSGIFSVVSAYLDTPIN